VAEQVHRIAEIANVVDGYAADDQSDREQGTKSCESFLLTVIFMGLPSSFFSLYMALCVPHMLVLGCVWFCDLKRQLFFLNVFQLPTSCES
jgi:hypothetical protein